MGLPAIKQDHKFADELAAYRVLRRAWRDDPERYVRERLGLKPTWQQRKIFAAIADPGAKVSVRSGHGTGKSGALSGTVLWFMETRDYPKIPCTAPTAHQLRDVLWAELAKWIRAADALSAKRGDYPSLWLSKLFTLTNERLYDPSARGEWFAVARTSSKDNPDALQGFHATDAEISDDGRTIIHNERDGDAGRLLFVVDEASGVPDQVFEVAEGALSSHAARLLMAANPTKTSGYFADSHHRNRGDYKTIHLKSGESPLVAADYRQKLVRKWGENSNIVRVRADGEFPKQDDDVLIALEWAENAIAREAYANEAAEIRVSVDPARFGDDRTVLVVRQGRNLLHIEIHSKQGTMQTVGQARNLRKKYNAKGIWVGVAGFAGIADRLKELGEYVVEVSEGAEAPKQKPGEEFQPHLIRDHMWYEGMKWLRDEQPSFAGVDPEIAEDLAGELASIKYTFDSSGRLKVESKDEVKKPKRLGRSPDLADGVLIGLAPDKRQQRFVAIGQRTF